MLLGCYVICFLLMVQSYNLSTKRPNIFATFFKTFFSPRLFTPQQMHVHTRTRTRVYYTTDF